jgi:hypothetical protein
MFENSFLTKLCTLVAMLHFPECVHKAQVEIDAVVGQDRMPNFEDQRLLPYVDGFIKETLRYVRFRSLPLTCDD